METVQYTPVGIVKNEVKDIVPPHEIKSVKSSIIIHEEYSEALLNISECEYIDIVFWLHKSKPGALSGTTYFGDMRGVFASRSPLRPNHIGLTSVKLLNCTDNVLEVEGLDAIDGTPVLDIKCSDTSLFSDEYENNEKRIAALKSNPRMEVIRYTKSKQTALLLIRAAQLHGHFCPGLAMGIMAACYAMNVMEAQSDGLEDLLAIAEINNCFVDGVQYVTGCSLGNNSLLYYDLGKTAFSLVRRNGKGIRIIARHDAHDTIKKAFPEFGMLYRKVVEEQNRNSELIVEFKKWARISSFATLELPFDTLFEVKQTESKVPQYALMHKSVLCRRCSESVMETRTVMQHGEQLCYACAGYKFNRICGNGIECNC